MHLSTFGSVLRAYRPTPPPPKAANFFLQDMHAQCSETYVKKIRFLKHFFVQQNFNFKFLGFLRTR